MAQGDVNLIFSSAQALTTSNIASTGVLDLAEGVMLTGTTYDNPPPLTHGTSTVFGEDLGIGPKRLKLGVWLGSAFVGGTSLNIAIQGAIDNASGSLSGLTWNTFVESGAQVTARLLANTLFPMPDYPIDAIGLSNPPPRFIRLLYQIVGTYTGGTIATAGFFNAISYDRLKSYPGGFSVGA